MHQHGLGREFDRQGNDLFDDLLRLLGNVAGERHGIDRCARLAVAGRDRFLGLLCQRLDIAPGRVPKVCCGEQRLEFAFELVEHLCDARLITSGQPENLERITQDGVGEDGLGHAATGGAKVGRGGALISISA